MTNQNIYEIELPSSSSEIQNYPKKIKISTLTVQAFKLYSNLTSDNFMSVLKDVLSVCIQDKDIKAGNLKFNDAFYLLLWLRINSALPGNSDELTYDVTCQNNHSFKHTTKLSGIEIRKLDGYTEPVKIKLNSFPDQSVFLKILSFDEEIELVTLIKNNDPLYSENMQTIRAAYSINASLSLKEKLRFLDSLNDISDLAAILDFIEKYSNWGFTYIDRRVKCPECGSESDAVLPLTPDIFIPILQYSGYFEKSRVT